MEPLSAAARTDATGTGSNTAQNRPSLTENPNPLPTRETLRRGGEQYR